MRLKEWEQGPLKRLGTLLLSAAISELTVHDLEDIREGDQVKVLADINKGRATRDDFEFENGKPVQRKLYTYIDMKGMKESFTPTRKTRQLNPDSTNNTLVRDKANPDATHKIPVTEQYVMPDCYVESGVLFDTKVDSKRMITNKKIRDAQSLDKILNIILQAAVIDPTIVQRIDFGKFIDFSLRLADMEEESIMKTNDQTTESKLLSKIAQAKDAVQNPAAVTQPTHAQTAPMAGAGANPQQPSPVGTGQAGPANPLQAAAGGAL